MILKFYRKDAKRAKEINPRSDFTADCADSTGPRLGPALGFAGKYVGVEALRIWAILGNSLGSRSLQNQQVFARS
jgi:hypothetical protein